MEKKNYKSGFVVLHYMAYEMTVKCINTLEKNIRNNNYVIIIVDNGSSNGSGKKLCELYKDKSNIIVLQSDRNLGFAKGNNIGIEYAVNVEKCDFVAMINNDVLIRQADFIEKIVQTYLKYNAAVIGPKIILKDGSTNSISPPLGTAKQYKKTLFFARMSLLKTYMGIDDITFTKILFRKKGDVKNKEKDVNILYKDVVLHGCCLVFTPKYLNVYCGINPKTFLFREEELLYLRLIENNMMSVYNPDIVVMHIEDVSTDASISTKRKKKMFLYKNQINSLKILIDELEKSKNINICHNSETTNKM